MNFQTRKIRPEKPKREEPIAKESSGKTRVSIGIFSSLIIIVLIIIGIFKAIASIDVGVILKVAGSDVKTDSYGHTNFLLLGNGGGTHDGADLTDTIMIASLDHEQGLITMVSIPRDLYIDNPEIGSGRINQIYYNAKVHYGSPLRAVEALKKKSKKSAAFQFIIGRASISKVSKTSSTPSAESKSMSQQQFTILTIHQMMVNLASKFLPASKLSTDQRL